MKSSDKNTYSAENLQKAALCIPRFNNKRTVFLCPHCGAEQKTGGSVSQVTDALVDPYPVKSDRIRKLPGAVFQKCPKCGGICVHPEYREPAITGFPSWVQPSESLPFIGAVLTVSLWSACCYLYVKTEFPNTLTASDFLYAVLFIAAVIVISGAILYFSSMYGNSRRMKLSEERLKNPEYLKTMLRFGMVLPVRYLQYLNRAESADTQENSKTDVYPLIRGTCGYCGHIVKKSWEIQQVGRALSKCPYCGKKLFDPNMHELAFHEKSERQNVYEDVRNECRKILLKRTALLAALVIGAVLSYVFFTLGLNILFDNRFSFMAVKASAYMKTLILGGLFSICTTAGIFMMIGKIRTVMRMLPASFSECLNDSCMRMKKQEYAENYEQGRSFFFDTPEDEQSDEPPADE